MVLLWSSCLCLAYLGLTCLGLVWFGLQNSRVVPSTVASCSILFSCILFKSPWQMQEIGNLLKHFFAQGMLLHFLCFACFLKLLVRQNAITNYEICNSLPSNVGCQSVSYVSLLSYSSAPMFGEAVRAPGQNNAVIIPSNQFYVNLIICIILSCFY